MGEKNEDFVIMTNFFFFFLPRWSQLQHILRANWVKKKNLVIMTKSLFFFRPDGHNYNTY